MSIAKALALLLSRPATRAAKKVQQNLLTKEADKILGVSETKIPTERLKDVKGRMGEQRGPGDSQYDELRSNVERRGYTDEEALDIRIEEGEPVIYDGNTRAAVARDTGVEEVSVKVSGDNPDEVEAFMSGRPAMEGLEATDEVAMQASQRPRGLDEEMASLKAGQTPKEPIKVSEVYHASPSKIDEFSETTADVVSASPDYTRFGFHFGTKDQALKRSETLGIEAPVLTKATLDIQNPLRLPENRLGRSGPDDILKEIMEGADKGLVKGIPEKDVDAFFEDEFIYKTDEPFRDIDSVQEQRDSLRAYLESLGFDGIVYSNKFEGAGDSFIAFSNKQIKKKN